MKEQPAARPDARKVIDTVVEAMRKGTETFDDDFSLVPSDFEVQLHPEAYKELEAIFPIIEERTAVRLDRELELLNAAGAAHALRRFATWLKRMLKLSWLSKAADATTKQLASARYKPAGYGWRIRFNMTLDTTATAGYIAVIAQLAAPRRDNLAGPKTLRLTVRGQDGSFKTQLIAQNDTVTTPDDDAVSEAVPAAAPQGSATVRTTVPDPVLSSQPRATGPALARLSFKDDSGPRTYTMNQQEIAVGRGDDAQTGIDLRLNTLPDISRLHLRLRYDPTQQSFFVKDVSSYGTTLDGRPVTPSTDPATGKDLDHWEAIPPETTIGLAGVLFIDFKSLL